MLINIPLGNRRGGCSYNPLRISTGDKGIPEMERGWGKKKELTLEERWVSFHKGGSARAFCVILQD